MQFAWDAANVEHIARHGITPEQAEEVMLGEPVELGPQDLNGEVRFHHVGETRKKKILFVVVTVRAEKVRVVTAFPASKKLRT